MGEGFPNVVVYLKFNALVNSATVLIGSLGNDVFERHKSTGSGIFALLGRDFGQILGQIVSKSSVRLWGREFHSLDPRWRIVNCLMFVLQK